MYIVVVLRSYRECVAVSGVCERRSLMCSPNVSSSNSVCVYEREGGREGGRGEGGREFVLEFSA